MYRSVPFAQEVVYQGLMPQQLQLTLAGMRIHPACVDRMDPVLTFVEPAVVETIQERPSKDGEARLPWRWGLLSPEGTPWRRSYLAGGDNYHRLYASTQHRAQRETPMGFRLHFSVRGPYRTGRWLTPRAFSPASEPYRDTTLPLDPFRKLNLYTALSYAASPAHTVELLYLGDYFYWVAYPGLIMDARHSAMHLLSVRHRWRRFSDMRLYANTVFHDMTDERRPLSEIQTRPVMPGMYMPMRGLTRVLGLVWEGHLGEERPFRLKPRIEGTWNQAWGAMDMYPVGPGAPMRLLNLADIRFWQGGSALQAAYVQPTFSLQAEATLTYLAYRVGDTLSFLPLELYQQRYVGQADRSPAYTVYQVGVGFQRWTSWGRLSLSLRQGTRPPTHTELYGYYLYVPMDNSFWMGNSRLRPERLLRGELLTEWNAQHLRLTLTLYANRLTDYIAPVTFLPVGAHGQRAPSKLGVSSAIQAWLGRWGYPSHHARMELYPA